MVKWTHPLVTFDTNLHYILGPCRSGLAYERI
jgi:hypothetical protein